MNKFTIYDMYHNIFYIYLQGIDKIINDNNIRTAEDMQKLETLLFTTCYYKLQNTHINAFEHKLKSNIAEAIKRNDTHYIKYITSRFCIAEDILDNDFDIALWSYKYLEKPIIKLKQVKYHANSKLSKLLHIHSDMLFNTKYKLIKLIHKYINDHNLQSIKEKHIIKPNKRLRKHLLPLGVDIKSYTYYNLPNCIKPTAIITINK